MPRLAADQLDHVVELHVDHVDHLAALALADADDLVFELQDGLSLSAAPPGMIFFTTV